MVQKGWTKVGARNHGAPKKGRWEKNPKRRTDEDDRKSTTFFITEFADCWEARDLYHEFKDMGDIDEVFIPNKRTRWGKKYGFVRFFNVSDEKLLETKLDNVFLEGKKIFANIPKFGRGPYRSGGNINRNREADERRNIETGKGTGSGFEKAGFLRKGLSVSYADVTKGESSTKCLDFSADRKDVTRFEKTFVGEVIIPGSTYSMQDQFYSEGFFSVKVIPLGANLCILEDAVEGVMETMMEGEKEWLDRRFKEVRKWKPADVDPERMIWLKVFDIPCQAWSKSFFEFISKPVGSFVREDAATASLAKMDVARLLIRTKSFSFVREDIKVQIDGNIFLLLLVEDADGLAEAQVGSSCDFGATKDSSTEESVNDSEEEEGSDSEYVPETAEEEGVGGSPVLKEVQNGGCEGAPIEDEPNPRNHGAAFSGSKGVSVTPQKVVLDPCYLDTELDKRTDVSPRLARCPKSSSLYGDKNEVENLLGSDTLGPKPGFLSFDEACLLSKNARPKPRKRKEVKELGGLVEISQSYYACLNPNFVPNLIPNKSDMSKPPEEVVSLNRDPGSCCESITESEIIRCNSRIRNESNVGKILKASLLKLGLVCVGDEALMQKNIEEMEERDKEGLAIQKAKSGMLK